MKNLIITAVFVVSQFCFSQNSVTKKLGDFNKITSFDQIDVLLIQSDENKISINGKGADEVEIINKNGELKIRMPITKLMSGDNISVTIYCDKIDAVEANEGSRIASESLFKEVNFNIIAKEGSQIKINLDVDKVVVKGSEGSEITLNGNAKNQDVLMNSGAIYAAEKLITNQTVITVNAGGVGAVFAKDLIDAKVRAGGNITIYGKPKEIKQKVTAGGTIKEN